MWLTWFHSNLDLPYEKSQVPKGPLSRMGPQVIGEKKKKKRVDFFWSGCTELKHKVRIILFVLIVIPAVKNTVCPKNEIWSHEVST